MEQYDKAFPEGPAISFLNWTALCTPIMVSMVLLAWLWLYLLMGRGGSIKPETLRVAPEDAVRSPMSREEWAVLGIFGAAIFLWLFRSPMEIGSLIVPGWGDLFMGTGDKPKSLVDDATVAICASVALFLLPASAKGGGGPLMRWKDLERLPWGTSLLFGGGFALAEGLQSTGFSDWLGGKFTALTDQPPLAMMVLVYLSTSIFGELASNTAVAQVLLPVAASISRATSIAPALLMMPVALGASLDFLLPAATPPNAIAIASGRVTARQLFAAGLFIEFAGALVVALAMLYLAPYALGL
jgi:sodium-dependent dicarboxylate transporter 2/3/5